ncbi:MAG: GxxExxY protein, partial [Vicinamibacterales bacterium]
MLIDAPFNDITEQIIGGAIEVHRELGPGLMESSYLACLCVELQERKLRFEAERPLSIVYKGRSLDVSYRLDAIVEDQVVLELKSVERLLGVHEAQVLTYMRLTNCPVGLLINFNVPRLVDGIRRV